MLESSIKHRASITGLTQWPAFEADSACGSMVLYEYLCSVFPRGARKNRTPTQIRFRSAEGQNADRVTPVNKSCRRHYTLRHGSMSMNSDCRCPANGVYYRR